MLLSLSESPTYLVFLVTNDKKVEGTTKEHLWKIQLCQGGPANPEFLITRSNILPTTTPTVK